jgi:cytochrome c oxidase subunit 4
MEIKNTAVDQQNHKGPSTRSYVTIWLLLLLLTAVTVTSAGMNFGGIAIIICLAIAAFKSTMVLLYFMHLRYEQRMLVKIVMPIAIAALAIFIGLTYTDVIFR